jgi:hypothetical protein
MSRRIILGLVAGAILVAAASQAPAVRAQSVVVPPQALSFPLSYGEWGARWWQYVYGIPAGENPIADSTGAKCNVGQWGPVFFLANTTGGAPVTRKCEVPAGTGLFFPIVNASCAIPDDGSTAADIEKACKAFANAEDPKSLLVTIDGKRVPNLGKTFRANAFFSFTGVNGGLFENGCTVNAPPCYVGFRNTAYSDGYWIMLKPLSPGQHIIHFQGAAPSLSFSVNVTYNLKVVAAE